MSDMLLIEVSIGDAVMCDIGVGEVVACVAFLDHVVPMVLVDAWMCVSHVSAHSKVWRSSGLRALWLASDVDLAIAWHESDVVGATIVVQR